jgi:predicted DNA-binding transcriptional regulator AlpA
MKPLTIRGFKGMNNVLTEGGFSGHDDGTMTAIPKVILNADVTAEEKLKKRGGFRLLINLPNAHSAWANKRVLMVASEGRLYRFYPDGSKINLCAVDGPPQERLFYAAVDAQIYVSSRHWMGILDIVENQVSAWGIPIPEQPVVAAVSGSGALHPGVYQVCYTNVEGGQLSGSGMIAEIEILSDNSSISLLNKPVGVIAWATDPDGSTFYRAAQEQALITDIMTMEPLPTFLCRPPNPMRFIRLAFGRMWGAIDNKLGYSEPYRYDLYKSTNEFTFPKEIILCAYVDGGIFVGFEDRTIFLPGTEPSAMKEVNVGGGVAKNILAYCNNVPDLGNNVPVWVSKDGLMAGSHSGALVNITKGRVQFPAGQEGAAVSRIVNGQDQLLTSFKQERPPRGSRMGFGDSATCEVVRSGKVL